MSFAFTCFKWDSNHDDQSKSFAPHLSKQISNYGSNSCKSFAVSVQDSPAIRVVTLANFSLQLIVIMF
jgi:hypothetical protein